MDYKVKRTGSYEVEIFLDFKSKDVEEAFQIIYQKARSQMKMDGFRNGKIPLEIVEKTLGDSVIEDVSNHLLRNALSNILDTLEPAPVNMPEFKIEKVDRKKGAKIKGTYHAAPIFKLSKYKKLKINQDQAVITEDIIDSEIKKLQKENAIMHTRTEGELVQSGDTIQASIRVSFKDGDEIFKNENSSLEMTENTLLPGMTEKIIGMNVSGKNEFEITMPEDYSDENLAGKTVTVEIEIKEIKYSELPQLNDDFAMDLGDHKTMDELKASIRDKMIEDAKNHLVHKSKNELLTLITSACNIDIPPSMIESESVHRLDQMAEQMGIQFPGAKKSSAIKSGRKRKKAKKPASESKLNLSEKIDYIISLVGMEKDKFEKELSQSAARNVGEQLVLREIINKEKIKVSSEEIENKVQELYGEQFQGLDIGKLIENENLRSGIESRLLTEKAFEILYSLADVKKGNEIPVDQIGNTNE